MISINAEKGTFELQGTPLFVYGELYALLHQMHKIAHKMGDDYYYKSALELALSDCEKSDKE